MKQEEMKQVSSFIVGVNEDGSMTLTDTQTEGQTPLTQADMMEYVIAFGSNLKEYQEEQRLMKLIDASTAKALGAFLSAIKESTQQMTQEVVKQAKKEDPTILN